MADDTPKQQQPSSPAAPSPSSAPPAPSVSPGNESSPSTPSPTDKKSPKKKHSPRHHHHHHHKKESPGKPTDPGQVSLSIKGGASPGKEKGEKISGQAAEKSPRSKKNKKEKYAKSKAPKKLYQKPGFWIFMVFSIGVLGFVIYYCYHHYMTYEEGLGFGKFHWYRNEEDPSWKYYQQPVAVWVHGNGTAYFLDKLVSAQGNQDISPFTRNHVSSSVFYFRPELVPPGNCVPERLNPPKYWGNGTGPGGCWTYPAVGIASLGVSNWADYQSLVKGLGNTVLKARMMIVLEPGALCEGDSLATQALGTPTTEVAQLAQAVAALKETSPNARVYIAACSCDEAQAPIDRITARLQLAGIAQADGFALNVALYNSTQSCINYGTKMSGTVEKPFIIDTGRNGRENTDSCVLDPPQVYTGIKPTISTGNPLVDAYLWVWPPGYSDGRIYEKFTYQQCLATSDGMGDVVNSVSCSDPGCPLNGSAIPCFTGRGCWKTS